MRIVGGEFGGRRFSPPAKNWPTRPTTDYAKEALFNILQNRIDLSEISVLDLFGGTGSISYEFVSRGCQQLTYVERHRGCVEFVKSIAEKLKIEDAIEITKNDVFKFLKSNEKQFDLVFADPPYDLKRLAELPDFILESGALKKNGLLIVEHDKRHDFGSNNAFTECRTYGNVNFSFFQA